MLHRQHLSTHTRPMSPLRRLARCGLPWTLGCALGLLSLSSQALEWASWESTQPGLKWWSSHPVLGTPAPEAETLTGWRMDLWSSAATPALASQEDRLSTWRWRLLGDYHFAPSLGWRLTGGLQAQLSVPRANDSVSPGLRMSPATWNTTPYVGLGYNRSGDNPARWGGWSLAADMGLLATRGGSGLKLGHAFDNTAGPAGDLLRELRFTPVLQLGASYAF